MRCDCSARGDSLGFYGGMAVGRCGVTNCKATAFGDDMIAATKMAPVATHRSDGEVMEDAIRSCTGTGLAAPRGSIFVRFSTRLAAQGASDLADMRAIEMPLGRVAGAGGQGSRKRNGGCGWRRGVAIRMARRLCRFARSGGATRVAAP